MDEIFSRVGPIHYYTVFTWRIVAVYVQPHFDGAEGERKRLRDLHVRREAGSGVAEEGDWVEDGPAALFSQVDVRRREVKFSVNFAQTDKVFASGCEKNNTVTTS